MTTCTRCGIEKACSEAEIARLQEHDGPPLPAGVCIRCILNDPELKATLDQWSQQRVERFVQRVRDLAARPLEVIDRFVESFR